MPDTIQVEFGAYLLSQATIVSACGTDSLTTPLPTPAIYKGRATQDSNADPYITFKVVYKEEQEVGGPPEIASASIQICCRSLNPDTAASLAETVRSVFRYTAAPFLMGSFTILGTWIEDSTDNDEAGWDFGLFEEIVQVGMQFELPSN